MIVKKPLDFKKKICIFSYAITLGQIGTRMSTLAVRKKTA